MATHPYDLRSALSIKKYSKKLIGKSLEETVGKYSLNQSTNKGRLGSMVEEHFFQYIPGPNRNHEPDFAGAGVELKVTGVVKKSKSSSNECPYKAKERLVLTMINYYGLADETWESSSLLKKCRLMLILFYLYEKELPATMRKFVMEPVLWEFPKVDLEIIQNDWIKIQQKVLDGAAHTLSEGDTFYLAAARKGPGGLGEKLREQPFSDIKAKSRAFSLKTSYVNTIIDSTWTEKSLVTNEEDATKGIEVIATRKFDGLQGKPVDEIAALYGYNPDRKQAKGYLAYLSLRILGTNKKWLPEFIKADIEMKTIRLTKNGTPKEAMSFPTMDFIETSQQDWEDSLFYEKINKKFFFVVYQYDNEGVLRFNKVMFWNMTYDDRLEAKRVWERTVDVIMRGDMSMLPKSSQSRVAHVRPHGKNKLDVKLLPNGNTFTKQCFWLNKQYLKEQITNAS